MSNKIYSIGLILTLIFFNLSCKKDDREPYDPSRYAIDKTKVYIDDAYENRLKDSVWFYYKSYSLWESNIEPATVNYNHMRDSVNYLQKNYTQYFQTAGDVLGYLMYVTKAKANPKSVPSNVGSGNYQYFFEDIVFNHKSGESKEYDWFSFLDRGGFVTGRLNRNYVSGNGMDVVYVQNAQDKENADLYVRYVEPNSAAYNAGLKRGYQILTLNGDTKIDFKTQNAENFNTLRSYLNSSNLEIKYKDHNGAESTMTVNSIRNYVTDPMFLDTVLTAGAKKVGYFGLSTFPSLYSSLVHNGKYKSFNTRLTEVFEKFNNQNIQDLVIDLRYNGGGSVLTAESISNFLIPSGKSGELMYTNKINNILKSIGLNEPGEEFAPVYFSKIGNLNLSKVYFLVSEETASASELVINVLKPYMNVYLVGAYRTENGTTVAPNTYGKPVGFFPEEIVSSNNLLYVASFQMFNKDGYGDFFDGLKPNVHAWEYDSFHDFGDRREGLLATALAHIQSGIFKSTRSRSVTTNNDFDRKLSSEGIGQQKIQGMYKFPRKKIQL